MRRWRTPVISAALLAAADCGGFATPAAAPLERAAAAPITVPGAGRIALVRRGDFFVAPVTIGGRAAGEFLVDTGAGVSLIDRGVADALGLPPGVGTRVQGALFTVPAEIRALSDLAAGGVALVADPTVAIDLGEVSASVGSALAGIIGFPTLGTGPVTIDFTAATLTIHDPERFTPPAGVRAEILRVNQVPYVEATLARAFAVWLQLDTGSLFAITLWRDFVQAHPDVLAGAPQRRVRTSGVGGDKELVQAEVGTLHVLGRDADDVPVIVQDAPPRRWRHPRIAGRVGLGLLKDLRITMHPLARRIWIEP